MKRALALVISVFLGLALVAVPARADSGVILTSAQLTKAGFPKKPNVVAWKPGTAKLSTNKAAQWEDIIVSGKAPSDVTPGQLLTLQRFIASDKQGSGDFKDLNITTSVNPNGTFAMRMQLGYVGTYGYRVGFLTDSATPEFVGFQFQLTITGDSDAEAKGSANAVSLSSMKLARFGFTKTPNTNAWPGTATLSRNRAPAGAPITISGSVSSAIPPGTVLQLSRFVPTDKLGSGHAEDLPARTVVKDDGTYELTFEVNQEGTYGYSLTADTTGDEVNLVEFQITTT